jgi:methionyl aminopeptidase
MMTKIKNATEILAMRESGQILATILKHLGSEVKPGVSTKDLAVIAKRELSALGGEAPFLGYQGFPDVICISLNDEVVHGIPSPSRIIYDGDLVSLDFGVNYRGMITDSAVTLIAGKPKDKNHSQLLKYTKASLVDGIAVVKDGVRVGDIGAAVQSVLDKQGYGIVRDLVGHGVGHQLHEDPNVPNYGRKNSGPWLSAGMTIAIEPMATMGSEKVMLDPDHWTVRTRDHSMSAHFEHTILITETGSEVLTELDVASE